jgi:SulP family sulfate permease
MAGVMVVVAAFARVGRYLAYIPWPVIEGFTVGIAVIIFLQQLPSALGVAKPDGDNTAVVAAKALRDSFRHGSLGALGLVVLVAAVMLIAPRLHRSLPASLLAVAVATIVAQVADLSVSRIGKLPGSLPAPSFPAVVGGSDQRAVLRGVRGSAARRVGELAVGQSRRRHG